jgi:hypothetical protein
MVKTSETNDAYIENTTTYFMDRVMKTCDRRGYNRGVRLQFGLVMILNTCRV